MRDSEGKEAVYNVIKALNKAGYTIIYVTNNTEEIMLADKILILEDGKIVEQIDRNEILDKTEIIKKYNLKLPTTVRILDELRKNNINIMPEELTIEAIVKKIIEQVKI